MSPVESSFPSFQPEFFSDPLDTGYEDCALSHVVPSSDEVSAHVDLNLVIDLLSLFEVTHTTNSHAMNNRITSLRPILQPSMLCYLNP